MQTSSEPLIPRTTADLVFAKLHEEIVTLQLLPGTKISEAEVASRLGVSRQPVRDAFNRLNNLDLLLIRPQRATVVRGFSMENINNSRFVRRAVELEVVERACAVWDDASAAALEANLAQQRAAIAAEKIDQFHALDFDFHKLICELSGYPLAFEVIETSKRKVDRICMLSLGRYEEVSSVLADHEKIAAALKSGSVEDARVLTKKHLSRLDDTINGIHEANAEYFE